MYLANDTKGNFPHLVPKDEKDFPLSQKHTRTIYTDRRRICLKKHK